MPMYYIRIVEPENGGIWQAVKEFDTPLAAKQDYASRIGKAVSEVGPRMSVELLKVTSSADFYSAEYAYTNKSKTEFLKRLQYRPF